MFTRMVLLVLLTFQLVSQPHMAIAGTEFKLTDMQGKQHKLSDYRGKWVLVNYWATWCPPCLEEIPDLNALYDQRKDVMLIGVVMDYSDMAKVNRYVDDMLMSYPIVEGRPEVIAQIGSAEVLPSTYLYDPAGRLVKTRRGLVTRQYIEQLIDTKPAKP